MEEDEKYCVCLGMKAYGGGFVKGLCMALRSADETNQEKIKATWPDLWKQYLEMGKRIHKEE